METKHCPKCGEDKAATLEFFYASKQTRSGLFGWCKECLKADVRRRNDSDEYRSARRQHYYDTHPGSGPMRHRTEEEKYAAKLETSRAWKERNRTRARSKHQEWKRNHPEECRALENKRRARKQNAGGDHDGEDVRRQYERQHGLCYYCGEKVGDKYHVDHVLPIALGGSNGPENLVVACPSCNWKKHTKHPMEFAGILC